MVSKVMGSNLEVDGDGQDHVSVGAVGSVRIGRQPVRCGV